MDQKVNDAGAPAPALRLPHQYDVRRDDISIRDESFRQGVSANLPPWMQTSPQISNNQHAATPSALSQWAVRCWHLEDRRPVSRIERRERRAAT